MAEHEDGNGVGREVGQPQDVVQEAACAAPTHARKEKKKHLQEKACKDHAMDLPYIPEKLHIICQAERWSVQILFSS